MNEHNQFIHIFLDGIEVFSHFTLQMHGLSLKLLSVVENRSSVLPVYVTALMMLDKICFNAFSPKFKKEFLNFN